MLLFVDDFVVRTLSREAHLAKKGAELNAATAGAPAMLRRRLTPLGKLAVSKEFLHVKALVFCVESVAQTQIFNRQVAAVGGQGDVVFALA